MCYDIVFRTHRRDMCQFVLKFWRENIEFGQRNEQKKLMSLAISAIRSLKPFNEDKTKSRVLIKGNNPSFENSKGSYLIKPFSFGEPLLSTVDISYALKNNNRYMFIA